MGMQVGGGPGRVKSDINVTPLIDVVLVLLIIFLVTMPIMMRTITLDVPRKVGGPEQPVAASTQIIVVVKADLSVRVETGGKALDLPATDLARTLEPLLADRKTGKVVFVDFEDPVPWGETVTIMDSIRGLAADQLERVDPSSGDDPVDIEVALKTRDEPPAP